MMMRIMVMMMMGMTMTMTSRMSRDGLRWTGLGSH